MEKLRLIETEKDLGKDDKYKEIKKDLMHCLPDICRTPNDLSRLSNSLKRSKENGNLREILLSLAGRNLDDELPAPRKTSHLKDNIVECKKLKLSVYKLLDQEKEYEGAEELELLNEVAKLLTYELRKGEWLEQCYYPELYQRAVNTARGEINQFLIRQKNTAILDDFRDVSRAPIVFKDDLVYLVEGNPENSGGTYDGSKIQIRISPQNNERNEWEIYLIAVHEILHSVSFRARTRSGIGEVEVRGMKKKNVELNEAVTDILTFVIAKEHLEKKKTSLLGENKNLDIADMAYPEYIYYLKSVLDRVPLSFFIDAMMNNEGLERLVKKFDEEFEGEKSFVQFGKEFKELYIQTVAEKRLASQSI